MAPKKSSKVRETVAKKVSKKVAKKAPKKSRKAKAEKIVEEEPEELLEEEEILEEPKPSKKSSRKKEKADEAGDDDVKESEDVEKDEKKCMIDTHADKFKDIQGNIHALIDKLRENPKARSIKNLLSINRKVKDLEKESIRLLMKKNKIKRKVSGNQKSGFSMDVWYSPHALEFTGWDTTKQYCRNDMTRFITSYVTENNLAIEENRRHFMIDERMAPLFPDDIETVSYAHFQRYVQVHYSKNPFPEDAAEYSYEDLHEYRMQQKAAEKANKSK